MVANARRFSSNGVESSGKFYFARPDRMRWDYLEGQRQVVVGDGNNVWIYQPDLEQVYRVDYGTAFGRSLGKKKANKQETQAALKKVESEPSAIEGKTFGDLLKEGKLPGKAQ